MSISTEINSAIAVHLQWKHRLRLAIAVQKSDLTVEKTRSDHACKFGQWLHALPPLMRDSGRWQRVAALHAAFHKAAARVLAAALEGRSDEANDAMAPGGEFSQTSALLIAALRHWKVAEQAAAAPEQFSHGTDIGGAPPSG